MNAYIIEQINKSIEVKRHLLESSSIMSNISTLCRIGIETFRNGNKIVIAGNGGSAADSQHIAGELISRFYFDRPALPAIALTTDTSVLTAIGNDYGYEDLFSRQVEGLGVSGDLFIAISTSGNSPNIVKALKTAAGKGLRTAGFTGEAGGDMATLCDVLIKVPSHETPRIQESHILIGHIMCAVIEKEIFGRETHV